MRSRAVNRARNQAATTDRREIAANPSVLSRVSRYALPLSGRGCKRREPAELETGRGRETIALHFCARPRGNRKLRYLVGYPPPDRRAPLWRPTLPVFHLPSVARARALELGTYFSPLFGGDAEVWSNPECNRHSRGEEEEAEKVKEVRGRRGDGTERREIDRSNVLSASSNITYHLYSQPHSRCVCTYVILSGKGWGEVRYVWVGKRVYGVSCIYSTYLPRTSEPWLRRMTVVTKSGHRWLLS